MDPVFDFMKEKLSMGIPLCSLVIFTDTKNRF